MKKQNAISLIACLLLMLGSADAQKMAGDLPFLSPLFGDDMVLQRGKPDVVWGWSDPGVTVQVQIGDRKASGVAAADHRWQVSIQPPPAGGPYTVKISGPQTIELHNVMVGDLWLCGGQSNMELPLSAVNHGEEEVKAATHPEIRFFKVAGQPAYHPAATVKGSWQVVSPGTAGGLSAVAYYFALRVEHDIHVPIGLIVDAVGGTPVESWTSAEALAPMKDFAVPLAEMKRLSAAGGPEYGNYVMPWYDQYDVGQKEGWSSAAFQDAGWQGVSVPGGFAELGVPDDPALVWFRKEVTLPEPLPPGRSLIFLGPIQKMDTVYVNGSSVGGSAWSENPRVYPLRDGILKPGRNVIAIRVLKTEAKGGFLGKPDDLHLTLGDHTSIPLAGMWKAKLSLDARPPQVMPIAYENWPVMPSVLYNSMLAPLAPLSLTGALWYQGEQNSPRGFQYRTLLPAMIADWRRSFQQGNFPFYIVSLPAFKQRSTTPVEDDWAEIRESQALVASSVPNSCLAVTIDTGDASNLHPKEKKPVGDRLALCALRGQYGEKVVSSGPTLASVDRTQHVIRLHFTHVDGGLTSRGAKLEEFSIAGADHKWYWAEATLEGDTVVLSSPSVSDPQEARYAWQGNPAASLYNGAGLPAVPFRTDTWPLSTASHRPY